VNVFGEGGSGRRGVEDDELVLFFLSFSESQCCEHTLYKIIEPNNIEYVRNGVVTTCQMK
jgi:hypothetical protein